MRFTREQLQEIGYPIYKEFADTVAAIDYRLFGNAVILWPIDRYGHDHEWMYDSLPEAAQALHDWNGTGEPTGWRRHSPSMRRRTRDGQLYVNPGEQDQAQAWFYSDLLARGVPEAAAVAEQQATALLNAWRQIQQQGGHDE